MLINPKPREQWTQIATKQELVAALGDRLREDFPTTGFVFTQPIIDMVTQDTNGTSANLSIQLSGADSEVLLDLARRTLDMLKTIPGRKTQTSNRKGRRRNSRSYRIGGCARGTTCASRTSPN
jgi:cobalt-zinc-cadmium resistance protein CzcA